MSFIDSNSKGLICCVCENCSKQFFRSMQDISVKSSSYKNFSHITEKKIVDACRKGDLSLLKPKTSQDEALIKINICDVCWNDNTSLKEDSEGVSEYVLRKRLLKRL